MVVWVSALGVTSTPPTVRDAPNMDTERFQCAAYQLVLQRSTPDIKQKSVAPTQRRESGPHQRVMRAARSGHAHSRVPLNGLELNDSIGSQLRFQRTGIISRLADRAPVLSLQIALPAGPCSRQAR